jgi:hypothetical protein
MGPIRGITSSLLLKKSTSIQQYARVVYTVLAAAVWDAFPERQGAHEEEQFCF